MSLTRITSDLIKDGTVAVADLASATKTAISGSSASGSVSTRTTALETASGSFSTRITNATASINSISSSQATRTANLVIASSSLSASVATLKGSGTLQSVATNASPTFAGATITGTLTAQEVHTEFESASIIFSSGSTKFGDTIDDTHQVTGSLLMTGSMAVGTGRGITPNGIFDVGLNNDGTRRFSVSFEDSLVSLSAKNQSNNGEVLKLMGDGLRIHTGTNTSGTEKMRIDSSGKVGIGTNNPGYTLDVEKAVNNDWLAQFHNTSTTNPQGLFVRVDDADSNGSLFGLNNNGTYHMLVSATGNVGIGTTSMDGHVHTYSDQRYMLYLQSTYGTARKYWFRNEGTLQLGEGSQGDSQVGFTFDVTNKKLAIGTRSTTAELTVIGQISGSNTIKAGQIADNGKAFMADVIDGGAFDVLEVTENGNFRWGLVFEGNAAENALTLNSNALSNVANIEPDGTIYLGVQQSTLQKNSSHRLSVQAPANTGGWISTFANNSYPAFNLYRTNSTTIGSYSATANNDPIGAINWYGSSASAHTLGASIDVRQDGAASTNTPARMDFYVSNGANISNKLMSLDGSSQRVAIGVGLSPSGQPNGILEVKNTTADDYAASFHNIGNAANYYGIRVQAGANDGSGTTYMFSALDGDGDLEGALRVVNGTFALYDNSDRRLKNNIRDTKINGTDIVNSIKVRDFEWKKSGLTETAGFIAQELKESFEPASVDNEDDLYEGKPKMMSISRERLVPVLVKAIQELSAKIDELQNQ